jgi:hypothetical protein
MSGKDRPPPKSPSREERLAKALRDNLARRKALVRAKRSRTADRDKTETEPRDDDGVS